MTAPRLTIGALSAQTHCTVPTIRYYEQIGLLPPPARGASGHRFYRAGDVKRLRFIKRCRDFGFAIDQVRDLAGLLDDSSRPCVEVRNLAQTQLDAVRGKLSELRELETTLAAFVDGCDTSCKGGNTSACVILHDISALPPGFATERKRL